MLIATLIELFERDLKRLETEIQTYRDESLLWQTGGDIRNSPGNLVLHLVGNLNHYIGGTLGHTGYVRNRDREFTDINIPRPVLLEKIRQTATVIRNTLSRLQAEDLESAYPLAVLGKKEMTTMFFLIHLTTHLNYHLGQINYHRRLTG